MPDKAEATRQEHQELVEMADEDDLRAAEGLVISLLVCLPVWWAVGSLVLLRCWR